MFRRGLWPACPCAPTLRQALPPQLKDRPAHLAATGD